VWWQDDRLSSMYVESALLSAAPSLALCANDHHRLADRYSANPSMRTRLGKISTIRDHEVRHAGLRQNFANSGTRKYQHSFAGETVGDCSCRISEKRQLSLQFVPGLAGIMASAATGPSLSAVHRLHEVRLRRLGKPKPHTNGTDRAGSVSSGDLLPDFARLFSQPVDRDKRL